MILPIVAYGDPVLKKQGADITPDYPELEQLIDNMYLTMYNASGVGLAAPQIGKSIRLFIVDGAPFAEDPETGISPLRKRLLQSKLNDISKGRVEVNYRMRFPNK